MGKHRETQEGNTGTVLAFQETAEPSPCCASFCVITSTVTIVTIVFDVGGKDGVGEKLLQKVKEAFSYLFKL